MRRVIELLWLPFLMILFAICFDLKYDIVGISFLLNCIGLVFFLIIILLRKNFYGLLIVFYIFNLIFLNLIPWLNYSVGVNIWRGAQPSSVVYLIANFLVATAGVVTYLSYICTSSSNVNFLRPKKNVASSRANKFTLLALSIFGGLVIFYMNSFSIPQMLFRGVLGEDKLMVVETSSLAMILEMVSRFVPVFCFLYAATEINGSKILKIILFGVMVFAVFPTGVARYMVAFSYMPVIMLYLPRMRNGTVLSTALIGSIIFVFPFLDQFRYFSGFDGLTLLPSVEFFQAAHFDAYENFASVIDSDYVTYGKQLLGVMFFYIPRTFWVNKPVGSGYQMSENLNYIFNNISMPYLAEGFVNFGYVGVVIFALLIGYVMKKMDSFFWAAILIRGEKSYNVAIYFYFVGVLFFILRGDLMSSVAYAVSGLVSAILVKCLSGTR